MALLDKRSTFARELSIPAAGGPAKFGEAIPLSVAQDWGVGDPLQLQALCAQGAVGGTSITMALVTADNEALTTNVRTLVQLPTFTTGQLLTGTRLFLGPIPSGLYSLFMGIHMTVVGTYTAGKLNIFIPWQASEYRAYPANTGLI